MYVYYNVNGISKLVLHLLTIHLLKLSTPSVRKQYLQVFSGVIVGGTCHSSQTIATSGKETFTTS